MTINGRSRVTSVRWVFVAIILTLPASEQSIWCADNGCAKQFGGFGSCVNLAAPIQINALAQRFDLAATSLKGLCGTVGCCHCMKLLPNSTTAAISGKPKPIGGSKKPTAKRPGKRKPKPKKPKSKKPKPKKPKRKKPKSKKSKIKKPKLRKPKENQIKETLAEQTKES